jgi:hypothetical protein
MSAPLVANDFHAYWKPNGGATLRWSVDGQLVGPKIKSPDNANDIDYDYDAAGYFTDAYWTKDGVRIKQIPIPLGANDVHVRLQEPRMFTKALWTLDGNAYATIAVPPGADGFDLSFH